MKRFPRDKRNRYVTKVHRGLMAPRILVFLVRLLGVAFIGVSASMGLLWFYEYALELPYFRLSGVTLVGCERVNDKRIIALMGVDSRTSVLGMDLKKAAERIQSEPWIEKAMVRRELPDELWVRVWERRPVALANLDSLYYMDGNGVPFKTIEVGDSMNYPIVTGASSDDFEPDRSGRIHTLERILAVLQLLENKTSPVIPTAVSEIHVEKDGALVLITRDHVHIRLGLDSYSNKFSRLAEVMEDLNGKDHWRLIQSIDLDYEDQAIVEYRKLKESMEQA
ncbi:MAG: FtsQ-type POTRA domain-containing protein [Deltaproteobacteria bacterium]|nr:FtsQ-type POTRA domain-containing protein [Deltaproteobacteria bacterium]